MAIRFSRGRFPTRAGSPIRTTYELKVSMKTGVLELFEKGKEDFQSYIQSFAESCDLENIIRRINAGELDLLNASPGSYGDFTEVPHSMQDVLQIGIDAQNTWASLSDEQHEAFGSYGDFIQSVGSPEWFEKFGIKLNEEVSENADVEQ